MHTDQSTREIQADYDYWLMALLRGYVDADSQGKVTFESYVKEHAFFITMTFDKSRIGRRYSHQEDTAFPFGSIQLGNFHFLYNQICDHVMGQNYRRKSKPKIFAFACLDADGTKYDGWNFKCEKFENLHVHAIVILPSGTAEKFLDFFDTRENHVLNNKVGDWDSLDIRPFKVPKGKNAKMALMDLMSYTTKIMRPNHRTGQINDEFRLYPQDLRPSKDGYDLRPKLKTMTQEKHRELNMPVQPDQP